MIKQLVMYKQPADEAAFLKHYQDVHLPIVRRIPGVEKLVLYRGVEGRTPPDYFLIAELYFANREALDTAMRSPENKEAARDLGNFALDIVSAMIAEEADL